LEKIEDLKERGGYGTREERKKSKNDNSELITQSVLAIMKSIISGDKNKSVKAIKSLKEFVSGINIDKSLLAHIKRQLFQVEKLRKHGYDGVNIPASDRLLINDLKKALAGTKMTPYEINRIGMTDSLRDTS